MREADKNVGVTVVFNKADKNAGVNETRSNHAKRVLRVASPLTSPQARGQLHAGSLLTEKIRKTDF